MAERNYQESGKSGTQINSGVITGEDYNPKVSGENGLKVYDEMRRSDATVNAALDALIKPVKNANFFVDPASEDAIDIEVGDMVRENLFKQNDWKKFLGEVTTFLPFGFDVHEMVLGPVEVLGKPRIALTKLGYRKQTTIKGWDPTDDGVNVKQMVDGKEYTIPAESVIHFAHKQEGDNFEGISVLRTSYQNWFIKSRLYKIDAVGHERHSLGVLDITVPKDAKDKDRAKLRKAARAMRANEQSYLEHPEGYSVEFLDMKASSMKDTEPSITHHDRQILKNVHAQFLDFGATGAAGSRATSESHSKLLQLSLQEIVEYIVSVIQQKVVNTLVDLNYNGRPYPTLRVGKISEDDVTLISQAIEKFVNAGLFHPTGTDENTTRKMLGYEELDKEQIDAIDYSHKPTAQPGLPALPVKASSNAEVRKLRSAVENALRDRSLKAA